jgi:hypothetical protein
VKRHIPARTTSCDVKRHIPARTTSCDVFHDERLLQ